MIATFYKCRGLISFYKTQARVYTRGIFLKITHTVDRTGISEKSYSR
jgi:hypothetical protein